MAALNASNKMMAGEEDGVRGAAATALPSARPEILKAATY